MAPLRQVVKRPQRSRRCCHCWSFRSKLLYTARSALTCVIASPHVPNAAQHGEEARGCRTCMPHRFPRCEWQRLLYKQGSPLLASPGACFVFVYVPPLFKQELMQRTPCCAHGSGRRASLMQPPGDGRRWRRSCTRTGSEAPFDSSARASARSRRSVRRAAPRHMHFARLSLSNTLPGRHKSNISFRYSSTLKRASSPADISLNSRERKSMSADKSWLLRIDAGKGQASRWRCGWAALCGGRC